MIEVVGKDLHQWDLGRQVHITSEEPFSEVHFGQIISVCLEKLSLQ